MQSPNFHGDPRVKMIRYILVDSRWTRFHECSVNENTFKDILELSKIQRRDLMSLKCCFVPPPSKVATLHLKIVAELKSWFESRGAMLVESDDAPAIVTIINSSNVERDIQRDFDKQKDGNYTLKYITLRIFS